MSNPIEKGRCGLRESGIKLCGWEIITKERRAEQTFAELMMKGRSYMIKGCRKKMVIVSGLKDSSFEAAYFVMRETSEAESMREEDIIERANMIIESSRADTSRFCSSGKEKSGMNAKAGKAFLIGFASGGIIWAVIVSLLFILL